MESPAFDEEGKLPPGVYRATLSEVLERFGQGTPQRRVVASRLNPLYTLAASTGHLMIERWQIRREGGQRGIVEIIGN